MLENNQKHLHQKSLDLSMLLLYNTIIHDFVFIFVIQKE